MDEDNLKRLTYKDKEIILIATAHVSKESAEQVKNVIAAETPDSVCIELDKQRYESMNKQADWQKTDVIQVIKDKKVFLLLVNMLLSSYQRKIATNVDTQVGKEMVEAITAAKDINANLVLADRDIQTTFMRIWRKLGLIEKLKILYMLLFSSFDDEEIDEKTIEELKNQDMLDAALKEVYQSFPTVAEVLIDERNQYLANKIKNAPGNKIIAVLGAAHVSGVTEEIDKDQNIQELSQVPNKTLASKLKGWILPGVIIALFIYSFFTNMQVGLSQIETWVLYNSVFSALACVILMAHPLTILTAFVVAPITSLNPLLAVGWFAGLVEAMIKKPTVADMQNVYQDITTFKGILKNRFIKILAIVILTNIFCTIGSIIGSYSIIERLIN